VLQKRPIVEFPGWSFLTRSELNIQYRILESKLTLADGKFELVQGQKVLLSVETLTRIIHVTRMGVMIKTEEITTMSRPSGWLKLNPNKSVTLVFNDYQNPENSFEIELEFISLKVIPKDL
jgi:hypothetical protein